jgi:predicted transcriptional regulator
MADDLAERLDGFARHMHRQQRTVGAAAARIRELERLARMTDTEAMRQNAALREAGDALADAVRGDDFATLRNALARWESVRGGAS